MPNEFNIKNGFITSGDSNVYAALNVTRGLTANIISATTYVNLPSSGGGTFTGGTVSGASNFTGGLSANTFSATTATIRKITGGSGNTNSGIYAFIGGGTSNSATGDCSVVGGGEKNLAQAIAGFVGGGECNNVCNVTSGCLAFGASVVGGVGNNTVGGTWDLATCTFTVAPTICNAGLYSFVGGGFQNRASGNTSTISGGYQNTATNTWSTVSGGYKNNATGGGSNVSGGIINNATASGTAVGGGQQNTASAARSKVGGGLSNTSSGAYSVISGGRLNTASAYGTTVAGGRCNVASAGFSSILGGNTNTSSGCRSTVGGGFKNLNNAVDGFIGGGNCNNVCNVTNGCLALGAVVVGGVGNNTTGGTWDLASCCFTAAPTICNAGIYSFVGGGFQNRATGSSSTISGGYCNTVSSNFSNIGGGYRNTAGGACSFIGGGVCNSTTGTHSFIGAGSGNTVTGNFSSAIGCGLNATAACTLYTNNIITGSLMFSPSTAPAYNGEIVKFGTGTLTSGQLYFVNSSGVWTLANASVSGTSTGMLGIAVGSSPTTDGLLVRGYGVNTGYTQTTGSTIYIATTDGALTATAPTGTTQVVRVVGYKTSLSNTIYFTPDPTWVTLA
jgi:hypothetical protein